MARLNRLILATLAFASMAGAAEAHVGHGVTMGFANGFLHPLSGIDHILAMVAVGLFAVNLGGAALWLVPSAFVGTTSSTRSSSTSPARVCTVTPAPCFAGNAFVKSASISSRTSVASCSTSGFCCGT